MKRLCLFILILSLCASLLSCREKPEAYELLCEFISAYGAEGIVYSPKIAEGKDGYIRDGFVERIYIFSGGFPENYAIFLNSHPENGSECGLFVCEDAEMLLTVEEFCIERIGLMAHGEERAFLKRSGSLVFYSTMQDKERAERLWKEIIR